MLIFFVVEGARRLDDSTPIFIICLERWFANLLIKFNIIASMRIDADTASGTRWHRRTVCKEPCERVWLGRRMRSIPILLFSRFHSCFWRIHRRMYNLPHIPVRILCRTFCAYRHTYRIDCHGVLARYAWPTADNSRYRSRWTLTVLTTRLHFQNSTRSWIEL